MVKRILLAWLILAPALAKADAAPSSDDDEGSPRSRLAVTLGVLTPAGELGVEYTQVIRPYLEISEGVGIGVWGPQGSIMPRLRVGNRETSVTLGAGVSGGPYNDRGGLCFDGPCDDTKTTVLWANVEAGYQVTSRTGASLRAYGGAGGLVARGACTGTRCGDLDRLVLPYIGVAIGHTL